MIRDGDVLFQVTFIRVWQIFGLHRQLRFGLPHKNKVIKVFRSRVGVSKRLRRVPKQLLERKIHAGESRIKSGFHWMPVRFASAPPSADTHQLRFEGEHGGQLSSQGRPNPAVIKELTRGHVI